MTKFLRIHFAKKHCMEFFENSKNILLDDRKIKLFLNGVKLTCNYENGIYKIYHNDKFIGTGIVENNLLKRDIII